MAQEEEEEEEEPREKRRRGEENGGDEHWRKRSSGQQQYPDERTCKRESNRQPCTKYVDILGTIELMGIGGEFSMTSCKILSKLRVIKDICFYRYPWGDLNVIQGRLVFSHLV